jgi:RNA-directed DNA polymerase
LKRGKSLARDLTGFIRASPLLTHRMDIDHNQPAFRKNPSGLNHTMYQQLHSFENLLLAYRKASKGKRGHPNVAAFEYRLEDNLLQLQRELMEQTYQPGEYQSFYIHDPKKRLISAAPFRDRVVHHALCNLIEPIFEKSFIFDSYANRIGKGTHKALDRATRYARRFQYVLTCDIRQYFPSIDHEILRNVIGISLRAHFAKQSPSESGDCFSKTRNDTDVMWLVDKILQSGVGVLAEEYQMVYFPNDDPSTGSGQGLFAVNRPRGLPIGNLTSQFWANCYLNPFDHFVKKELRCKGYVRYVDDFLLFSNDKMELKDWREKIINRLMDFRLTLHEQKAQTRPVAEGIPFLGFLIFPTHRKLKRRKGIAFQRKYKQMLHNQIPRTQITASVQGWVNHVRYANTWGLRQSLLTVH